jgi:Ca2+-binding RTX toxin-like protein
MATYAFETITAAQAQNIVASDTLTFTGGPANRVQLTYSPLELPVVPRIDVTVGGRTVAFGTELSALSKAGRASFADGSKLVVGDASSERLVGTNGGDAIYSGAGNDSVDGGAGDDFIQGNQGDDVLSGDLGSNTIHGGQGDDTIIMSLDGETRGSWAHGNMGDDEVFGGAGKDTIYGGQGDDLLAGRGGNDLISGDLGHDEIWGGEGDDVLLGGAGNDTLYSGGGSDTLSGDAGDDRIALFFPGRSAAFGGAGNDTITSAAAGQDTLWGGEGRDLFEFVAKNRPDQSQDDVIMDWSSDDKLSFAQVSIYTILPRSYSEFVAETYAQARSIANEHITSTGAQYVSAQVGGNVYVFVDSDGDATNGADVGVILVGKTLADISLANFV